MRLEHLSALSEQAIDVPASHWADAYLIARIRTKANKGRRSPNQNRGPGMNHLVDLIGSLAELTLLYQLEERHPELRDEVARCRKVMFHAKPGSATKDADLVFEDDKLARRIDLDVKSMDCAYYKSSLLIDKRKHRLLTGIPSFEGYIAVFAPLEYSRQDLCVTGYATKAIVTRVIAPEAVEQWPDFRYSPDKFAGDLFHVIDAHTIGAKKHGVEFNARGGVDSFPGGKYDASSVMKLVKDKEFKKEFAARYPTIADDARRIQAERGAARGSVSF